MGLAAKALLVLLLAVGLVGAGFRYGVKFKQGQWDESLLKAERESRAEEQRLTQANTEIANEAQRLTNRNRADGTRAAGTDDRLRDAQRAYLAANSSAARLGQAAATLGELFEQCRADLRGMAEEADAARGAGIECSSRYDALKQR